MHLLMASKLSTTILQPIQLSKKDQIIWSDKFLWEFPIKLTTQTCMKETNHLLVLLNKSFETRNNAWSSTRISTANKKLKKSADNSFISLNRTTKDKRTWSSVLLQEEGRKVSLKRPKHKFNSLKSRTYSKMAFKNMSKKKTHLSKNAVDDTWILYLMHHDYWFNLFFVWTKASTYWKSNGKYFLMIYSLVNFYVWMETSKDYHLKIGIV